MDGTPAEALLHLHDVRCERGDRLLFRGLGFTLCRGTCLRLVGANGAGKTTCLRGIAGLHGMIHGRVECRQPFLFLGHRPGISGQLTVTENLLFRASLAGMRTPGADDSVSALRAVNLASDAHTPVWQLSAGQQRRVSLGLLFLPGCPDLWILDEPFTSLDVAGTAELAGRIADHCKAGGAVLLTSHQSPGPLVCETVALQATRSNI